jgi:hypothetical protein
MTSNEWAGQGKADNTAHTPRHSDPRGTGDLQIPHARP